MASHFMLSEHQPMMRLALLLRHLPLSLHEAYLFCVSPTDPDDTPVASALLAMATAYCSRCGTYPVACVLVHAPAPVILETAPTTLLRCCLVAYSLPREFWQSHIMLQQVHHAA